MARRSAHTAACRGCRDVEVPVLDAFCPACLAKLPPALRTEVEQTHTSGAIAARLAAQDRARAWLIASAAGRLTTLEEINV